MVPAGEMQQACEDCDAALKLDPTNKQLLSLRGELNGPGEKQCAQSLQGRAHARFASGQYAASADAFSALEHLHRNDPVQLASAISNKAMCMLCMHQFDKALAACQAAFTCATTMSSIPQGSVGTVVELLRDKIPTADAAPVLMRCVGRMAACFAHMKLCSEAERLYSIAGGIAQIAEKEAASQLFFADAQHMRSLASSHTQTSSPISSQINGVKANTGQVS